MIENVYEIIDELATTTLIKRLLVIKEKINSDDNLKIIIKRFNDAKESYKKYGTKEKFINAKKKLIENKVLKEYMDIQNRINLLSIKINGRIKNITEGITDK